MDLFQMFVIAWLIPFITPTPAAALPFGSLPPPEHNFRRYIYTGNNPVNLADPGGHAWISGTAAKVLAAGGKLSLIRFPFHHRDR